MEKRNNYFVSLKNGWTWISAALMLAAVVARVLLFGGGEIASSVFWMELALPVAAGVYFIVTILVTGREHFYRTSLSAWGFLISYGHLATLLTANFQWILLLWVVYLAMGVFYAVTVGGKIKQFWLLWLATAGLTAWFAYTGRAVFTQLMTWKILLNWAQNVLMSAAFLTISLAIQIHPEGSGYHPTWGDRADGRRLRSLPGITNIIPYIMTHRNGSCNHIRDRVELTEMERYIWKKRREGLTNFGVTHVFLTSYLRMVAEFPAVNRFCSGQKVYSRGRNVEFSMAIKKEMTVDAPDTTIKLHLDPGESVESVYEKLSGAVKDVKGTPLDSDVDNTIRVLTLIPGLILKFVVWLLKTMDYFGLFPGFLLEVSPFHGSVFFTSMGSLGIPPIVHHLYDFGNVPVFIAFGCKYKEREILPDGKVATKKYIDYTANTDERITDGFYFATAMKTFNRYLEHPSKLDEPIEVRSDVD